MKAKNLFFILLLFSSHTYAQEFEWVRSFGSTDLDANYHNIADEWGNIYVTGSFRGEIDFDDSGLFHYTSQGEDDMYLLKLNSSGEIEWVKIIGGSLIDKGVSIAIDQDNNIYVTGDFQSQNVDFDGTGMNNVSSQGLEDIFLLKYNSDGLLLRSDIFGSILKDAGISLDIDTENNLLLTGFFSDIVDFDPSPATVNLHSAGSFDGFVLKMNSEGDLIWAKAFNGTDWVKGLFVKADIHNNYYITGYFRSTADFNPHPTASHELEAQGLRDFYITKLDKNGNLIWAGSIGSIEEDRALSIAIDTDDNVYLGGYFGDETDFDIGTEEHMLTSNGNADAFLLKMDTDGQFLWVKQFGATGNDRIREVKISSTGDIYLTGQFESNVDFNPSDEVNISSAIGGSDIFILKLDTEGDFLWCKTVGGPIIEEAFALSLDSSNNLYISGVFSIQVDFDFGTNTNFVSSNGAKDVFLLKIVDDTAVANNNIAKTSNYKAFPNPSSGDFVIDTGGNIEYFSWVLFDILGQNVQKGSHLDHSNLQFTGLKKGNYLLQLVDDSRQLNVIKILIQ